MWNACGNHLPIVTALVTVYDMKNGSWEGECLSFQLTIAIEVAASPLRDIIGFVKAGLLVSSSASVLNFPVLGSIDDVEYVAEEFKATIFLVSLLLTWIPCTLFSRKPKGCPDHSLLGNTPGLACCTYLSVPLS